jgi:hypothetical protein
VNTTNEEQTMNDLIVDNGYPDGDYIHIITSDNSWNITVSRDEEGETHIVIADNIEGSQTTYVLGREGYSQKA